MKLQKLDFNIHRFLKNSGIAALVFGAAILFSACENDLEKIKAFSSPENLPVLEAQNFETLFTDSGRVRYTLKTPKLLRFENEGKVFHEFPNGIEIEQFDANGKMVSSLRADYAKQFLKEQKWEAKNNVVVTNEQGDTLKTEHLIWEEKAEKIYTDEFVRIIRPDQIITGIGFTSDESMQNWKITDLKGTLDITVETKRNSDRNRIETGSSIGKIKPIRKPIGKPLQLEK